MAVALPEGSQASALCVASRDIARRHALQSREPTHETGGRRGRPRGAGGSKAQRKGHGGQPARNSSDEARTDARTESSNTSPGSKGGRGAPGAEHTGQESSPTRGTSTT